MLIRLVHLIAVVHTGAADDLGDDHALRAVDDERTAVGHQGEISHKDLLILNFARFLIVQAHAHLDGLCVGRVALLALLHRVLRRLVHAVVQKAQLEIAGVVADGVNILEHLVQTLVEEPRVGILLDLQHIRDGQDLLVLCKALSQGLAVHDVLCARHYASSQPFCMRSVFLIRPDML